MQTTIKCSFCGDSFQQDKVHDCATKVFNVLNSAAQIKKDPKNLFKEVDNMVFQGGGVKGLGYLGVMDQLLKENPDIFKNLKRVAGNSAGSITALYIALNLEYKDISELMMKTDYEKLLDDGIILKVCHNIEDWFGSYAYKNFKVVDVVFTAKTVLTYLIQRIKASPNDKAPQTELQTIIYNMIRYYGSKLSITGRTGLNSLSSTIAKYAAKLIISFLTSDPLVNTNNEVVRGPVLMQTQPSQEKPKKSSGSRKTSYNAEVSEPRFEDTMSEIVTAAYNQYQSETPSSNSKGPLLLEGKVNSFIKTPDSKKLEDETVNFYLSQSPVQATPTKLLAGNQQPLLANPQSLGAVEVQSRTELAGPLLHYALGELLWFILVSQTDYNGFRQRLGLFTGNRIQKELLEGAIKLKFDKLGRSKDYKEGFTFQQLYDFKDNAGKRLFKPFYVTAYNPLNNITEVFSVEHSPNAVACEAVRASMSIPVFFQPARITENGEPRVVHAGPPSKGPNPNYKPGQMISDFTLPMEIVDYMDGGVLDNYPLYIFDDLKYCVDGALPKWVPQKKIAVQNPRTLGFKLLSSDTILKYEQPYYDKEQTQRKKLGDDVNNDNIGYVVKTLLKGLLNSENEFLKYGNCPRSVFVDDCGFSATAFDLKDDDKAALIQAGRTAVLGYKVRAEKGFLGEGEKYSSQVPTI